MTPAELRTFPNADPETKSQIIAYISEISDPQTAVCLASAYICVFDDLSEKNKHV